MKNKTIKIPLIKYLSRLEDYPTLFAESFEYLTKDVGKSVAGIADTLFENSDFVKNKFKEQEKFRFKLKNHSVRGTKVKEKEIFIALVENYEQFLLPFLKIDAEGQETVSEIEVLKSEVTTLRDRVANIELALMKGGNESNLEENDSEN